MNCKERCRLLTTDIRELNVENDNLRTENAKLLDEIDELRKTCIIFDKENAELKAKLEFLKEVVVRLGLEKLSPGGEIPKSGNHITEKKRSVSREPAPKGEVYRHVNSFKSDGTPKPETKMNQGVCVCCGKTKQLNSMNECYDCFVAFC